jgi:hypothetical protein
MQLSLLDCLPTEELVEWCRNAAGGCPDGGFAIPISYLPDYILAKFLGITYRVSKELVGYPSYVLDR